MGSPSSISIFLATHLLFFASSLIAALVFYLHSRPHWGEVLGTLLGGIVITWRFGLTGAPYVKVMVFLSYWTVCALVVSFFVPFFTKKNLRHRIATMERMFAPALLELLGAVMLGLLNRFVPQTLDYYLYAFDSSLGYPPGFLAAQFLVRNGWLRVLAEASYINLTLAMAIAYLVQHNISPEKGKAFFRFVVTLGLVGFLFYLVFPAAGTEVVSPGKLNNPPDIASMSVLQTPDPREPRNCMPSLHTAWALALWWTAPRKFWARLITAIFVGATLLYTLACGHYFADMIAAVPFAIAVYAFTLRWNADCVRLGSIASAIFLSWLVLLRFGTGFLLLSPLVPIVLTILTLLMCWAIQCTLETYFATAAAGALAAPRSAPTSGHILKNSA